MVTLKNGDAVEKVVEAVVVEEVVEAVVVDSEEEIGSVVEIDGGSGEVEEGEGKEGEGERVLIRFLKCSRLAFSFCNKECNESMVFVIFAIST